MRGLGRTLHEEREREATRIEREGARERERVQEVVSAQACPNPLTRQSTPPPTLSRRAPTRMPRTRRQAHTTSTYHKQATISPRKAGHSSLSRWAPLLSLCASQFKPQTLADSEWRLFVLTTLPSEALCLQVWQGHWGRLERPWERSSVDGTRQQCRHWPCLPSLCSRGWGLRFARCSL